jgi:putative FmdB family regulatory protein
MPSGQVFRLNVFQLPGAAPLRSPSMPIYEFECPECQERFEQLMRDDLENAVCVKCGSTRTRRLLSQVAPPGRQPRGAAVRSDESQRREREAARGERLAETRRKRTGGETPPARGGGEA